MKGKTNRRYIQASVAAVILAGGTLLLMMGFVSEASATHVTTQPTQICEDNDETCAGFVGYADGSWKSVTSARASGGSFHVSTSTEKAAYFGAASGPSIGLRTFTGRNMGYAKVLVFDIFAGEVVQTAHFNLKTGKKSKTRSAVRWVTGLDPDGSYALLVVSANGRPVVVDGFVYSQASPPTPPPATDGSTPPPPDA